MQLHSTKKISSIPKFEMDYFITDDEDKVRLIDHIKAIARNSLEYKEYMKYLKEVLRLNKCSFFTNINTDNIKRRVSVQIHHEPLSMFDICEIILDKHIQVYKNINPYTIADEVMYNHYNDKVGLIPLSATVHQLVENGKEVIPIQCVFGDYTKFLLEYKPYINNRINDKLFMKIEFSKSYDVSKSLLNKKYVYFDVDEQDEIEFEN
jgi:hypothetical protein